MRKIKKRIQIKVHDLFSCLKKPDQKTYEIEEMNKCIVDMFSSDIIPIIDLSVADSEIFANSLLNPKSPNKRLREAVERYKKYLREP